MTSSPCGKDVYLVMYSNRRHPLSSLSLYSNPGSYEVHDTGFIFAKQQKQYLYISLQFPAEKNTKGSKTPTTLPFYTNYDYRGRLVINKNYVFCMVSCFDP